MSQRAKKEHWQEQKKKYAESTVDICIKLAEKQETGYRSRLYDLASKVVDELVIYVNKYSIDEMIKQGIKPKDITGAIRELEDAMHIKSEKDLEEQQARIDSLRQKMDESSNDGEIKVVFAGDSAEEYSA